MGEKERHIAPVPSNCLLPSQEKYTWIRTAVLPFRRVAMNNAVQLWDGHLSVITRPVPHIQNPLDVVVKITYSGISGTDLKVLEGKFPCDKSVIMGHEFVGVVKEVGSEVKHVSVGDR